MTPKEWIKDECKQMGLSLKEASRIIGAGETYLANVKNLDYWDAMAALTDINRHVAGKEPIMAFKKHMTHKRSKKMKAQWKKQKAKRKAKIDAGEYFDTDDLTWVEGLL